MYNIAEERTGKERVLSSLEDTDCTYCVDGTLVRETYKGNNAVVCESCGVPGAQVW